MLKKETVNGYFHISFVWIMISCLICLAGVGKKTGKWPVGFCHGLDTCVADNVDPKIARHQRLWRCLMCNLPICSLLNYHVTLRVNGKPSSYWVSLNFELLKLRQTPWKVCMKHLYDRWLRSASVSLRGFGVTFSTDIEWMFLKTNYWNDCLVILLN